VRIFEKLKKFADNSYYRTISALQTKGWDQLKTDYHQVVSNLNPGALAPTVSTVAALNKYRSWVYPCVNLIQRKISMTKYYLYQEIGQPDDEEFNRIINHPFLKLLKNPNKFYTGRHLMSTTQMHLDLCGCAFWRIVRNGAGRPAELHIRHPHELVQIEFGTTNEDLIRKFVFASVDGSAQREEIPYNDIVYFHYPHPMKSLAPYSPIQALCHVTDLDLYLQVYEKDFFMNNARPDYMIVTEHGMSPTQVERIKEGIYSRHRGPGKQHRPIVIPFGADIRPLSLSAKDFEFLSLSQWTKSHILAAYGVPEAMLGLYESFNRASSITAETTFAKQSLEPRMSVIEGTLNLQLLPQFGGMDDLEFKFESALPKDDEWELTKNQSELTMGLTTPNEIRKRQGRKPFRSALMRVPWVNGQPIQGEDEEADKLIEKMSMGGAAAMGMAGGDMAGQQPGAAQQQLPSNLPQDQGSFGQLGGRPSGSQLSTLLNEAFRSSKPSLSKLLSAARGNRGGLRSLISNNPEMASFSGLLSQDHVDTKLSSLFTKGIYDYIEKQLDNEIDKTMFRPYEDMIKKVERIEEEYMVESEEFYVKKGVEVSLLVEKMLTDYVTKESGYDIDEETLREDYIESAKEYVVKAFDVGFRMGYKLVNKFSDYGVIVKSPDVYTEESKAAAGKFLNRSADLKVISTKKVLSKIIKEGIDSGLDSEVVAERIRDRFANIGASRASMIARTELAGAVWEGLDASYEKINKDAGKIIVEKSLFFTSLDERVCETCEGEHGKVVKDYETGKVYIKEILHPNCRCVQHPMLKK
jgi:HK97 family phage portal protein